MSWDAVKNRIMLNYQTPEASNTIFVTWINTLEAIQKLSGFVLILNISRWFIMFFLFLYARVYILSRAARVNLGSNSSNLIQVNKTRLLWSIKPALRVWITSDTANGIWRDRWTMKWSIDWLLMVANGIMWHYWYADWIVFFIETSQRTKIDVSAGRETRLWNQNWKSTRKKHISRIFSIRNVGIEDQNEVRAFPRAVPEFPKINSCRCPFKRCLIALWIS